MGTATSSRRMSCSTWTSAEPIRLATRATTREWPSSKPVRWVADGVYLARRATLRWLTSKADDAEPSRVRDGVGAAYGIKLVEKRADVKLGGVNRNAEPAGDDLVRGS